MLSSLQKAFARETEHPQPVRKKVSATKERRYLLLKVTLKNISPPIWRRFVVPNDYSLAQMHECLQIIMGWENSHLYEFIVGGRRDGRHYSVPMDEFMSGFEDFGDGNTADFDLSFLTRKGMKFAYIYDFGDSWDHELVAENVDYEHSDNDPPVVVLAGKRNCPPEDCGGSWGYANLVAVLADKDHPEHEDMLDWCGEYDPEEFDMEEINTVLAESFGKPKPRKKVAKKGTKKSSGKT